MVFPHLTTIPAILVSFRYTNDSANNTTVQVPVFLSYCFCFSVFGRSNNTIAVPTFNTRECLLTQQQEITSCLVCVIFCFGEQKTKKI